MPFLVLGMGRTGCAVSRYLLRCGEKVVAVDDHASWESIPEEFSRHPFFHFLSSKEISKCDFSSIEECITSPGFPPQHPLFAFLEKRDIRVVSEIEFAGRLIHFPLIGITGSCGKSTTVALIGHILSNAGMSVFVGGNFGVALIESLERESQWDWGVVEVSSFQLEWTQTVRFRIASLLNLFPNHLNYHQTMERYFQVKSRIFAHQKREDVSILNFTHPEWQTRLIKYIQAQMVP
ncbi:MAG: Mur ligase family protein, partial [Candidatus Caldatribacteriaceae bacterium]